MNLSTSTRNQLRRQVHRLTKTGALQVRSESSDSAAPSEGSSKYPHIGSFKEAIEQSARKSSVGGREAISRDMGDEAESSRSRRFKELSERFSSMPAAKSITESLNPSWRDSITPPSSDTPQRVFRGVHDRRKRAEGVTPSEGSTINELMANMLRNLPSSSSSPTSRPRPSSTNPDDLFSRNRFMAPAPSLPPGYLRSLRILDRTDTEEDHAVLEELDALKEEMGTCRTDVDLINWARKRVFAPLPPIPTNGPLGPNAEPPKLLHPSQTSPVYPPVYPRILAHLLSYVRRNFNNPHLVLALFHHAQTQSTESYLSGCLAPAYSEVLKTRWESFKDLDGVEAGVREMETNGVAWDRIMAKTIGKIVDEVQGEMFKGTSGVERYGSDVNHKVAYLEMKLQKDIQDQARMGEVKLREKAQLRMRASRAEAMREGSGGQGYDRGTRREAYVS